jgi:hypothetical protein
MSDNETRVILKGDPDALISAFNAGAARAKKFGDETKSVAQTIKENWLGMSAAVGSALVLMSKGMEYVELGAKARQAGESFKIMSANAGIAMDDLKSRMLNAAKGTVDDSDIMQKAVKGMISGLNPDQMVTIMEASRLAARVAGEDVKTAYERITDAIASGMPRGLRQYLLITQEQMALVKEALKQGVEGVDLYAIAMANYHVQAAKMGPLADNTAEALQRKKARIQEIKEEIGGLGVEIYDFLGGAAKKWAEFWTTDPWGNVIGAVTNPSWSKLQKPGASLNNMTSMEDSSLSFAQRAMWKQIQTDWAEADRKSTESKVKDATAAAKAAKELKTLTEQYDAWKVKIENLNPELSKTQTTMATLSQEAQKFIKGGIGEEEVNALLAGAGSYVAYKEQWDLYETLQAKREAGEKNLFALGGKLAGTGEDTVKNRIEKSIQGETELAKDLLDIWASGATDFAGYQATLSQLEAKGIRERTKIVEDDARTRMEADNAHRLSLLNIQETEMSAPRGDIYAQRIDIYKSNIAALTTDLDRANAQGEKLLAINLQAKIDEQNASIAQTNLLLREQKGTFDQGITRGWLEYSTNMTTAFGYGKQAVTDMTSSTKDSFKEMFSAIRDGTFDWETWLTNSMNRIYDKFADMTADMLTNWIWTGNAMKAANGSGGGEGGLLGFFMNMFRIGGNPGNYDAPAYSGMGEPLGGGGINTAWAKGGILNSPSIRSLVNTVGDKPVIFPMARGYGLIREAGAEAVMPLKRTASGNLGVEASGGTGATYITILAVDSKSFADMVERNPGAIIKTVDSSLKDNTGGLLTRMKKVLK